MPILLLLNRSYFNTAKQIIETNLLGAMATIEPAISHFKQLGQGQLIGISSITAFRGLPTAAAYSASKIALAAYLEAIRIEQLSRTNIKITVLYPGFIDTPMIQHSNFHPFRISARRAAYLMVNLIENGVEETVPRIPWALLGPLLKGIPRRVINYFAH